MLFVSCLDKGRVSHLTVYEMANLFIYPHRLTHRESVCLFLGLMLQYILVLMASFLFVLLRGTGGQDGMINQPLTDELIHCRVQSRTTIETLVMSVECKLTIRTIVFNTACCLIHAVKAVNAVLHRCCMIKTSPETQPGTAGMISYSHFLLKKLGFPMVAPFLCLFIHGGDDCAC